LEVQAVNSVRSSLETIVNVVKDAAHPLKVDVRAGGAAPDDAEVSVIPVSMDRVGRSRRDGPILDLQLTVAVSLQSSGRFALAIFATAAE